MLLNLLYVADGRISPDRGFIIATLAAGGVVVSLEGMIWIFALFSGPPEDPPEGPTRGAQVGGPTWGPKWVGPRGAQVGPSQKFGTQKNQKK